MPGADLEKIESPVPSPDRAFASAEDLALLRRLLGALHPQRRAVLIAYDLEGLPMTEVAAALRIPLNTAWNRLRLARADLRHEAGRMGSLRKQRAACAERTVPSTAERWREQRHGRPGQENGINCVFSTLVVRVGWPAVDPARQTLENPRTGRSTRFPGRVDSKMTDYLGGQTPQQLEERLRQLITQGAEGPKVDFKKSLNLADKSAHAEMAKDVSSIANTDDEAHLDDFGYIILGAERGQLIGHVAELAGNIDKLQAQITDLIKGFVGPVPHFSIAAFEDPAVGPWGAIVIPPSARQPHLLVRDGAGVVKHEWWIRVNDTTERAGPHDYGRILAKTVRREVRPLEFEVQRLAHRLDQIAASSTSVLLDAIRGASTIPAAVVAEEESLGLAASVRRLLLRGSAAVEDALVAEALRVAEAMRENTEQNPWSLSRMNAQELQALLSYLEDRTLPLAEALATVARHDTDGVLIDAVCRVFRVIAMEPRPADDHHRSVPQLRLYPVVLCLYAITLVGANEGRVELLKRVFNLHFRRERRDALDPIVMALRRAKFASDIFVAALGKRREPIAARVREVLVPRLGSLLLGTPFNDAFFVAEFVLGLAVLRVSDPPRRLPLPGTYLYDPDATRPIKALLLQRPDWLGEVLGEPLQSLLPAFDENAERLVDRNDWADGFTSGAMEAYRPTPKA